MFSFCPSCASKNISFKERKVFHCPDCNFVYYHNVAAATGCLISVPSATEKKIVFLVRGKEPGIGKLDLPGGFVDVGEGVFEGLYRELREEIGWVPEIQTDQDLTDVFKLFASYSNVYAYKGVDYNTCDMYFYVSAPDLKPEDIKLEYAEISDVVFLKPEEIDFDKLAFESTKRAVKAWIQINC